MEKESSFLFEERKRPGLREKTQAGPLIYIQFIFCSGRFTHLTFIYKCGSILKGQNLWKMDERENHEAYRGGKYWCLRSYI